jgi:Lipid A 3-O-deacylase (PagL)
MPLKPIILIILYVQKMDPINSYKRKKLVLVSYMILCTLFSYAQSASKKNFVLSAQGHYGYVISHRGNMAHLIKGHIVGGELNYIFRTSGAKCWQPLYNYPEFGVCAVHLYLGNPSQLGNLDALYPYTNIQLNKSTRHFKLNLRLGAGLAYLSKPYDRFTNHKNVAIGSHFNGFVNLRLSAAFMLTPAWRMDAGVGLTHASNGAFKTPNLGLNMATVNLGIGYVFGDKHLQQKCDSVMPSAAKKWHPSLMLVAGLKELEHPGGARYSAYGLLFNMYYAKNYKNKLGAGIEMAYNNATRAELLKDSVFVIKTKNILQAGVKVGYAFSMDRLSFPIDFGVYFYKSEANNDRFFHRIGIRYMVSKHVIANISLLTHWAKADYFEWGIGYEL